MEPASELNAILRERLPTYRGAEVALASRRDGSYWECIRGRIEFTPELSADTNATVQYRDLLFERLTLPAADVGGALSDIIRYRTERQVSSGKSWKGHLGKLQSEVNVASWEVPSWLYHLSAGLPNAIGEPRWCKWPSRQFLAQPVNSNQLIDVPGPIADVNLGLVPDPQTHIDDFIGAELWKWPGTQRSLLVILPDFRARFSKAIVKGPTLEAYFEVRGVPFESLQFLTAVDGRQLTEPPTIDQQQGTLTINAPNATHSIQVMMLDSEKNEVIDWVNLRSDYPFSMPEVENVVPEGQLTWLVEQGEGNALELKEYPGEDSQSRRSVTKKIVETAIAFSNGNGGVIVVGVSDEREAKGVNQVDARHSLEQAIRDSCDPPADVTFENAEYGGKPVLVLRVPRGPHPLYTFKGAGTVFIRVGASNFRATSDEVLRLVAQRQSPGWR